MKITIRQLRDLGACVSQVRLFKQLFGDSVEVAEELAAKYAAAFDWTWAARRFLSDPAWAEYKRVEAPARAEHKRVTAQAWAEYEHVTATTFARLYNGEGE